MELCPLPVDLYVFLVLELCLLPLDLYGFLKPIVEGIFGTDRKIAGVLRIHVICDEGMSQGKRKNHSWKKKPCIQNLDFLIPN